jgi:hypothetical protein
MDVEWAKAAAPVIAGLLTAIIAIWTWYGQRAMERRKEKDTQAARYITPFMFAAEDLQSRLYNLVCLSPSTVLEEDEYRDFASETLYLLAQYFYYEPLVLQYTPYGRNPHVIELVQRVRGQLATAGRSADVDPWCIFRPRQRAIGRAITDPKATTENPSVMPLTDFERNLDDNTLKSLGIDSAVQTFEVTGRLTERSRDRLRDLQHELYELLGYLEGDLVKKYTPWYRLRKRRELSDFSLFIGKHGERRTRACDSRSPKGYGHRRSRR